MKQLRTRFRLLTALVVGLLFVAGLYGAYSVTLYGSRWFSNAKNTRYQTAKRTVEAMGYRDSEQFFTAPQEQPQQPQQPEQPEQSPEAQAIIAAEQIKAQASLQRAQMDNETRLTVEREKIASTERVAMFEAQQRIAIERQKALGDATIVVSP